MTSKNVAKGARRIVYSSAGFPSVSRMISAQGSRPRNQPPFIAMSQWKTSLECDDHVLMSFFGSGIPSRATHTAVLSHPQPRKKIPELNYVQRFRISATACFLAFFPGWHSPSSTLSPEAGERWKPQISFKAALLSKPRYCSHLLEETCKTSFRSDDLIEYVSKPTACVAPSTNPNGNCEL